MKCINALVSSSKTRYKSVQWAERDNGHYTYYTQTGEIYQEGDVIRFPCRKCYWCLQARAREWTLRCALEAREHKENCILTLTYENSPRELQERDVQLFLKRLRKHIAPAKLRYFYGGEYGTLKKRPHYHMIIFGWQPNDCHLWQVIKGINYYNSPTIDKLWGHGYVTIDCNCKDVGISYTCGYVMSKLFASTPKGLRKPYQRMSNRPGIGYKYFEQNSDAIYDTGIYHDGKKMSPPKYFDIKYRAIVGEEVWEIIRDKRMEYIRADPLGHAETQDQNKRKIKNILQKTIDKRLGL